MEVEEVPFTELLSKIVDNSGRTCPTAETGLPLIATNCVRNELLYPAFEKVRYVSKDTYDNWFRGHPIPGDLIFVCKGTPGRVCMTPDPVSFCIAQDMVAVRADPKKVYPKYLFALLRSAQVQAQIGNMHVGTLIPHFKKGDFDKLLLPVPTSRKIQETIGDGYFELSAKIELNRRMNATLEAMARALFQSWFVDSTNNGLPEGWRECALGELIEVKHGFAYQGEFFRDERCCDILLTPGNFAIGGGFKGDKFKYYEGPTPDEYILDEGDLVVTMTDLSKAGDTLGYGAILPPPPKGHRFHHNQRIGKVLVRNPDMINKPFLYQVLRSYEYRSEILGGATGTTVKHTSPSRIKSFKFKLPPATLMQKFGEIAGSWHELAGHNEAQSRTLATLRDTLLPKLLSGELSVNH